jgi:hypothetical protein
LLSAATLVAIPLAIVYDLMLASIAGLWLLRGEGGARLPAWAKWGLTLLFVLSLSPRSLAEHWHLPVGPCISLALFALTVAVALRGGAANLYRQNSDAGAHHSAVPLCFR